MNRWSAWASILYHVTSNRRNSRCSLMYCFQTVGETSQVIRKTPFLDRPTEQFLNQFRLWLCLLTDLLILLFSAGDLHELKPQRGAHCLQLSSGKEFPPTCFMLKEILDLWILGFRHLFSRVRVISSTPRISFLVPVPKIEWMSANINEYERGAILPRVHETRPRLHKITKRPLSWVACE